LSLTLETKPAADELAANLPNIAQIGVPAEL